MMPPIKIHWCLNGAEHITSLEQNEGESDESYRDRCVATLHDILDRAERNCTLT